MKVEQTSCCLAKEKVTERLIDTGQADTDSLRYMYREKERKQGSVCVREKATNCK